MLFQQGIPTRFTFTIGWVDLVIMVILIVVFLRWHRAFAPVMLVIVALYLIRLFPSEIIWLVTKINELNGPAAFITIGR
jgi:uncharacterized membrane protein YczE